MSLTINAKTYTADAFQQNSVGYIGAAKTLSVKDDVNLSRQEPKSSSTFSGLARTTATLKRTLTLTGALTPTGEGSVSILVQVPVGAASADIDSLLNDFGSFLASASYKLHVKSRQISF